MKGFGFAIKTEAKPERPIPDKAILWAMQTGYGKLSNGDNNCFPEIQAITARNSSDQPNPLATFGDAVSQAEERIWIIDEQIFKPDKGSLEDRINQILQWLPNQLAANDIRILTKSYPTQDELAKQFADHANKINRSSSRRAGQCVIEVRFTLNQFFDYIHDRFAIIDDELWHFGATVGGFHSKVSAATRGWRASDHGAEEFFELAWNAKSKIGKQK